MLTGHTAYHYASPKRSRHSSVIKEWYSLTHMLKVQMITALSYVHRLDSLASIAGLILILVLCHMHIQVQYVRSSSFVC